MHGAPGTKDFRLSARKLGDPLPGGIVSTVSNKSIGRVDLGLRGLGDPVIKASWGRWVQRELGDRSSERRTAGENATFINKATTTTTIFEG